MEYTPGTPCWMQADLNDLETGTSFFTNVLGWEISPGNPELGGYAQASVSGKAVSGVWPAANSPTPQPDSIDVWLSTNDIEKTLEKVQEHGGLPIDMGGGFIQEVMDLGYQALFTDPFSVLTGIWQPKSFHGIEASGKPGTPWWFEHLSADPSGAADFYSAIFDLSPTKHSDDFWIMEIEGAEDDVFGLTTPGPVGQRGWLVAFHTDNIEHSLDLLTRFGGKINGEPFDVEGMGRYCYATTPAGVHFGLFEQG